MLLPSWFFQENVTVRISSTSTRDNSSPWTPASLFAAGIIGTGLLAVPVLAGSAAYAVAEIFKLRGSLELPASRAIGFYAIVAAATIGGAALLVTKIDRPDSKARLSRIPLRRAAYASRSSGLSDTRRASALRRHPSLARCFVNATAGSKP